MTDDIVALFRRALGDRPTSELTFAERLARGSLIASAQGHPELEAVVREVRARDEAHPPRGLVVTIQPDPAMEMLADPRGYFYRAYERELREAEAADEAHPPTPRP